MGVRNYVELICDYADCKDLQNKRSMVSWCVEDIQSGVQPVPESAKTFVTLDLNGNKLAFCSRIHCAKFFAPASHDVVPKKDVVVDFPPQNWTGELVTSGIDLVQEEPPTKSD